MRRLFRAVDIVNLCPRPRIKTYEKISVFLSSMLIKEAYRILHNQHKQQLRQPKVTSLEVLRRNRNWAHGRAKMVALSKVKRLAGESNAGRNHSPGRLRMRMIWKGRLSHGRDCGYRFLIVTIRNSQRVGLRWVRILPDTRLVRGLNFKNT
jgi:hypothetical protein